MITKGVLTEAELAVKQIFNTIYIHTTPQIGANERCIFARTMDFDNIEYLFFNATVKNTAVGGTLTVLQDGNNLASYAGLSDGSTFFEWIDCSSISGTHQLQINIKAAAADTIWLQDLIFYVSDRDLTDVP